MPKALFGTDFRHSKRGKPVTVTSKYIKIIFLNSPFRRNSREPKDCFYLQCIPQVQSVSEI